MLAKKLSIDEVDLKGKKVVCRVDFNVPLDKKTGQVADTTRIVEALPTIKYILQKGASRLVLLSHLGRPDGRPNKKYSLAPVAPVLEKLLGRKVTFVPAVIGPVVEKALKEAKDGDVLLLENVRFHPEEEGSGMTEDGKKFKPSKEAIAEFRRQLSQLGDVYVNDAFGTAHRAHSSMVGVTLPIRAGGFLLKKELRAFSKALEPPGPARPFVAVMGGAKVNDKIRLIDNMINLADEIIIGGGMAYTFLHVLHGMKIGTSLFDEEGAKLVKGLVEKAKAKGVKLHFPLDFVIAEKFSKDAKTDYVSDISKGIPDGWMALDCGPKTCIRNAQVLWKAKTIIFNGPLGVFEFQPFSFGTRAALQAIAAATQLNGAVSIIGGGDSASAAAKFGVSKLVTHVSTGGGASLELLEGRVLPGIAALSDKGSQQLRSKL